MQYQSFVLYSIFFLTSVIHSQPRTLAELLPGASNLPSFAYKELVEENNIVDRCFFAPQDSLTIESVLIGLIRSTQDAIRGALFRLSNKNIIAELIEAHKRGVTVDIVLDPDAMSASQEISKLSHAGITLALYNQKKYGTYMHHKFLIFHNTLACEQNNYTPIPAVVAFGSLNLTENGFKNRENINFRNKEHVVEGFKQQMDYLKDGTDRYMLINQAQPTIPQLSARHILKRKEAYLSSRGLSPLTQGFKYLRRIKR